MIKRIGSMKNEIFTKIVQIYIIKSCNGSLYQYTIAAMLIMASAKTVR
jgi:hypothetical protein